jgi:hypothetical protein
VFRLARYREAGSRLGERAVLLDGVPASAHPSGTLAFGPDGRLYVAFDTGPQGVVTGYNGALLRLTPEGSTPADQRAASPVVAAPFAAPRSLSWSTTSAAGWIVDSESRVDILRVDRRTAVDRAPLGLAGVDRPVAVAPIRDPRSGAEALMVADGSAGLALAVRDRSPALDSWTADRLQLAGVPAVRALARAPDGSLIAAAGNALLRISSP